MTATCEPIFKLLKKDQDCVWTDDFQREFESIKEYLLELPILLPPVEGRPLIMYLTVLDKFMGCILGQQDEIGKKEFNVNISLNISLIVSRGIICWKRHVVLWLGRQSVCGSIC